MSITPRAYGDGKPLLIALSQDSTILDLRKEIEGRLVILGLRFEYDLRATDRKIHDISNTYHILEQVKRTEGRLKRCLMQGSFTCSVPRQNTFQVRTQK